MIGRRSLLLAGAAVPVSVSAYGQCVTGTPAVDACRGGVRVTGPAVPPGVTFDQSFLTGSLGTGAVFTRASAGWAYGPTGVLTSFAANVPRFDYDPVTLQPKGLLLEDTSTNIVLQSGNLADPVWLTIGASVAPPVVTADQTTAPDGTLTAARIDLPAMTTASGNHSAVYQHLLVNASIYAYSVWLKGAVGGEAVYIFLTPQIPTYTKLCILSTEWQRFTLVTGALPGGEGYFQVGGQNPEANTAAMPAQTIYAWGAQVESIGYVTSYIPTTTAAVTRAADALSYPIASVTGFDQTKGSLALDYILEGVVTGYAAPVQFIGANGATDYLDADRYSLGSATTPTLVWADAAVASTVVVNCTYDGGVPVPAGPVQRGASSWALGNVMMAAHNGAPATSNSGNAPSLPAVSVLTIGGPMAYQYPVSQWARRVRYWPRQLSQVELIGVTS